MEAGDRWSSQERLRFITFLSRFYCFQMYLACFLILYGEYHHERELCGHYKHLELNCLLQKDAAMIKIVNFSLHYFRILKALRKCSAGEIH